MLQLKKFPDIPVSIERKHESPAHNQRSTGSDSWIERRDPFPAWSGKNSRRSVASQEEALSTGKASPHASSSGASRDYSPVDAGA